MDSKGIDIDSLLPPRRGTEGLSKTEQQRAHQMAGVALKRLHRDDYDELVRQAKKRILEEKEKLG
jgi:hypothetical protein